MSDDAISVTVVVILPDNDADRVGIMLPVRGYLDAIVANAGYIIQAARTQRKEATHERHTDTNER